MGQRKKIKGKIRKCSELNENKNAMYQNCATEVVLRGKFIVPETYTRKKERSQISDLSVHHKKQEKEEQKKTN